MTPETEALVRALDHLVSLNRPENGGPFGGFAAQECVGSERDAELARAREVIRPFADITEWDIGDNEADDARRSVGGFLRVKHLRTARKFMEDTDG